MRALLAALLTTLLVTSGLSLAAMPANAAAGDVSGATLNWGFKQSFRSYISGPIASGKWAVDGNVTDSTPFAWTAGAGTASQTGATGNVGYTGSIHFQGHEAFGGLPAGSYALDLTLSDVHVTQVSATAAQVVVDVTTNSLSDPTVFVTSNDVVFATVDLAAATNASSATAVAYSAAPAVLTEAGAAAFAGFYPAGTALDPVSFSWPVEQPVVVANPVVTVTPNSNIDPTVSNTFTVTGTGFTGPGAASGAYVNVGAIAAWTPGTVPGRGFVKSVWVQPTAIVAGAFSTTITVDANLLDPLVTYGVSTFAANALSATDRTLDTLTPISLKTANPVVTVTPKTDIDPAVSNTFTVTGTGFTGPGAASGAYVNVGATSAWQPGAVPGRGFVKSVWVQPTAIVGGAFSTSITVDAAVLDPTVTYGVSTFAANALSATNRTLDTFTAITLKKAVNPVVTVTPKTNVDPKVSNTFTVTGTGFTGAGAASGAYVNVGAASAWQPGSVPGRGFVKSVWVQPSAIVDGAFSTTITVDANLLDPAVAYGVSTFAANALSATNRTLDTFTAITLKQVVTPVVTVTPNTNIDPTAATTFTISGTGFTGAGAANGTYVNVGAASAWQPGSIPGATGFLKSAWVQPSAIVGGAFSTTITIDAAVFDPAVSYGVSTFAAHQLSITDRTLDTFTPIAIRPNAPTPTTLAFSSNPATGAEVGTSVAVAATVSPAVAGTVTFYAGTTAISSVAVSAASPTATATIDGLAVGATNLRADFAPTQPLAYSTSSSTLTFTVTAKPVAGAGSLTWGVKESFRTYITGPIAQGSITTSGVSSSGGAFTFGQSSGGNYDRATGVGTSTYSGSVHFTGHAGVLDITLSNPVVRIESATQATLLVSVNGGASTPFATLILAAGSLSTPNNTVSYSGVPAALTSQGAAVFSLNGSGFYAVGSALDPVSFVIGAPSTVSTAVGATVASFTRANTADATPPATTGLTVAQGTTLTEGDEITVSASGYKPNETGILVVIYSTPTVLATNAKADANGVVTWTGRLPLGLSGAHTLTFQGSVDRGVELTINAAAATTAVVGCVVDDATITWGFKESFRAYISGSIANGEWVAANGATYTVPNFGWSAGTGGYDAETGEGSLAFTGSVQFTGHDGLLNTTVANPQIRFVDADTAYLLLDISGTTQDGAVVDTKAVEFAQLDLSGVVENDGGAVIITAAPATLTAAGSAAFGTYAEGEALDPVTVAFTTAADCAVADDEAVTPVATTTSDEPVSVEKPIDYSWIIWLVVALIVIAAAVVVIVVVRRRKK